MNGIGKLMVIAAGMMTLVLSDTAAAYYSPALGRFVRRDPVEYLESANLHEYLRSNPAGRNDPLGTASWDSSGFCNDTCQPKGHRRNFSASAFLRNTSLLVSPKGEADARKIVPALEDIRLCLKTLTFADRTADPA